MKYEGNFEEPNFDIVLDVLITRIKERYGNVIRSGSWDGIIETIMDEKKKINIELLECSSEDTEVNNG